MTLIRGITVGFFAIVFGLFSPLNSARADSVNPLSLQPTDATKQLTVWSPNISWAPDFSKTVVGQYSEGLLTISVYPYDFNTGSVGVFENKLALFNVPGAGINEPFSISVGLQITNTGSGYDVKTVGGSMVAKAQLYDDSAGTLTPLVFNDFTTSLVGFGINLNGTENFAAIAFASNNSTVYANGAASVVVAQIHYVSGKGPDGSVFLTGSGSGFSDYNLANQPKVDMFGASLPLPAPLYLGSVCMLAVAGLAIIKHRNQMPSKA